ncbi:TetR/AcrR family transcriptional regulator [Ensifer sp.]|uniref:TetR/AcrR family transcriptional regulator n=1 Tax=Ensifer sp. TaxID=1872086 RepID=UPI00289DBD01|nr:TetR/AcrR family transcriptional regulator [Ensifer sp.]
MDRSQNIAGKNGTGEAEARRRPQQARSKQKVEAILEAATMLIGEKGVDAVSMRDIARATAMPLSVIYQYFPNKSAIVEKLFTAMTAHSRARTAAVAATIKDPADFVIATEQLLDEYYETVRRHPAMADLINAVLADKTLGHLDVQDSRWHANVLYDSIEHRVVPARRDEFRRILFMFNHLIGGLMRLLLSLDDQQARRMLDDYKMLTRRQVADIFE